MMPPTASRIDAYSSRQSDQAMRRRLVLQGQDLDGPPDTPEDAATKPVDRVRIKIATRHRSRSHESRRSQIGEIRCQPPGHAVTTGSKRVSRQPQRRRETWEKARVVDTGPLRNASVEPGTGSTTSDPGSHPLQIPVRGALNRSFQIESCGIKPRAVQRGLVGARASTPLPELHAQRGPRLRAASASTPQIGSIGPGAACPVMY